eukprot:SAG31_NODE_3943_length_3730_cov_4.533462_1_plen_145_part_10
MRMGRWEEKLGGSIRWFEWARPQSSYRVRCTGKLVRKSRFRSKYLSQVSKPLLRGPESYLKSYRYIRYLSKGIHQVPTRYRDPTPIIRQHTHPLPSLSFRGVSKWQKEGRGGRASTRVCRLSGQCVPGSRYTKCTIRRTRYGRT